MGIRDLNKYLMENCSKSSIYKSHLYKLKGKTIVIDTSIYLYKYLTNNALIENMYLLISILLHYNITPLFIFDGKPPSEKKELLKERNDKKKEAEAKYNKIKMALNDKTITLENKKQLQDEMNSLKKQFVRLNDRDILCVKELIVKYGITYIDAPSEADQLCVYFVNSDKAWACLSDDMDMFVYGCKRVIRHISLLEHTVILYDTVKILNDLQMSLQTFREILVISGTDYNTKLNTSLYKTLQWYKEYKKHNNVIDFYEWLNNNTRYIEDYNQLIKIYKMFEIENYNFDNNYNDLQISKSEYKKTSLQLFLTNYGFIFID